MNREERHLSPKLSREILLPLFQVPLVLLTFDTTLSIHEIDENLRENED